MSSLKDLASLIMVPSLYKDGELHTVKPLADENIIVHPDATDNNDGVDGTTPSTSSNFTFSRGSNLAATRVDVNGLIEKGRENLLLQSNQFDTSPWINAGTTDVNGQAGYDGTNDAWLITKVSANGRMEQSVSSSGVNTLSVYAKANDSDWALIQHIGGSNPYAFFNLSTGEKGAIGGAIDSKIESAGNGWYKLSITSNVTISQVRIYPAETNTTGATSGSIYLQDAQLEQGLVATDYIETGASTAQAGILEDMPRLDYSGSCPSLLLEPSRTNVIPYSEYYPAATRVNITQNSVVSPEGVNNAASVVATSVNGSHEVTISPLISIPNTNTRTFSTFAKYNGNHLILNVAGSPTNWTGCVFDLQNGVAKTPQQAGAQLVCTTDIKDYGNGWYRCSITFTPYGGYGFYHLISLTNDVNATLTTYGADEYIGDDVSGIYLYGRQLEVASYPTSYIPTYGSSVTRSFDSCLATSVSNLIGQNQGTMLVDFVFNGNPTSVDYSIMILGAIGSNYITIGGYNKSLYARVFNSTSQGTINALQMVAGTRYKVAVAYAENDVVMYVNGVNEGSDTSVSIPALSQVGFSRPSFEHSADVKQSVIFQTRLTNAELAALTA